MQSCGLHAGNFIWPETKIIRWIQLPTHERAWITLLSVSSTIKEKAAAHFLFVLTPPEIGMIDRSCVRCFRRISSSWNTSNPPSLAWNQRECSWPRLLIINKLNRALPGSFDQVCTGATSLALLSKNDWTILVRRTPQRILSGRTTSGTGHRYNDAVITDAPCSGQWRTNVPLIPW